MIILILSTKILNAHERLIACRYHVKLAVWQDLYSIANDVCHNKMVPSSRASPSKGPIRIRTIGCYNGCSISNICLKEIQSSMSKKVWTSIFLKSPLDINFTVYYYAKQDYVIFSYWYSHFFHIPMKSSAFKINHLPFLINFSGFCSLLTLFPYL